MRVRLCHIRVAEDVVELWRGSRRYELSDWLGNVRVVVSDARVPVQQDGQLRGYRAEVVGVGDYYSFGGRMVERSYEAGRAYRWGFNGQEVVDEVSGKGNTYDFGARLYDGRIGRWLSPDPQAYRQAAWSAYRYGLDNPIIYYDPDGETEFYFRGRWIGSDGVNNNMVALVRDRKLACEVKKFRKKGDYYRPQEVRGAVEAREGMLLVNRDVLEYAYNMLLETREEPSKVGEYYAVLRRVDGNRYEEVKKGYECGMSVYFEFAFPEGEEGGENYVLVHSHPTGIVKLPSGMYEYYSADVPSDADKHVFRRFSANIIVGKSGENFQREYIRSADGNVIYTGNLIDNRDEAINFFGRDGNQMGSIQVGEAGRVLKSPSGKLLKRFQEIKEGQR